MDGKTASSNFSPQNNGATPKTTDLEPTTTNLKIILGIVVVLVILVSSILFTKKSPPTVDESTEQVEQEDETEVPLPKSSNADSLRAYNFAMTILMLTGAVYLIFSSNECTNKKLNYVNFIMRLFFLFWFVSSFVLSIRTLFSKFLTSKLLETFLLCINIGVLLVYLYKWKRSSRPELEFSNFEDTHETKWSVFLIILFLVYLEIVINIYAWKLGYGRDDDEANPQLGLIFMIFQIIWFFIFFLCSGWFGSFFLKQQYSGDEEPTSVWDSMTNYIAENYLKVITAL